MLPHERDRKRCPKSVSPAAYDTSAHDSADTAVPQCSTSGNTLVYSTHLGESRNDSATGLALDRDGMAYLVGTNWGQCRVPPAEPTEHGTDTAPVESEG